MNGFLALLIAGFGIATAVALGRGLMAFFRDSEHLRNSGQNPPEAYGVQQNRMMSQRVIFQAITIVLLVLFGAMAGHN